MGQVGCSAASGVPTIHAESLLWDQGERLLSAASSPTAGREPYCITQHVELSILREKQ